MEGMRPLQGSTLNSFKMQETNFCFGLWSQRQLHYLWVDLNKSAPTIFVLNEQPFPAKGEIKPIYLFVKSHFLGAKLKAIHHESSKGRIVRLDFEGKVTPLTMEIRLFPKGENLIARAGQSALSFHKSKILTEQPYYEEKVSPRTHDEILNEWLKSKTKISKPSLGSKHSERAKLLKAIAKIEEELKGKNPSELIKIGHYLKEQQTLKVPADWEKAIHPTLSLAENIEQIFTRAKLLKGKAERTQLRLNELKSRLEFLENNEAENPRELKASRKKHKVESTRYRSYDLAQGLSLKVGKSARDNLTLLREARAWDYWLHLRDFPGSHGILAREKNQTVNDDTLKACGQWLVQHTFANKSKMTSDQAFALVVTEKRFVQPVRGDRLGRVTFRKERTLFFRWTLGG